MKTGTTGVLRMRDQVGFDRNRPRACLDLATLPGVYVVYFVVVSLVSVWAMYF